MFHHYVLSLLPLDKHELLEFVMSSIDNHHPHRAEMLKAAIHLGLDPNTMINDDVYLLQYAIHKEDLVMVLHLVRHGADINKKNSNNEICLHIAVGIDNIHLINFIISKTNDINALDSDNNTPLLSAVCYNNPKIIDILIKNNADPNFKNNTGDTASDILLFKIYNIINQRDIPSSCIDDLLESHVVMYRTITNSKNSVTSREIKIIRDICSLNENDIIYHFTEDKKRYDLDIIKIITENNPSVVNMSCNSYNCTLLYQAIHTKKDILVNYLASIAGIDWSKKNKHRMTYLHVAAAKGNMRIIDIFLEKCPELINARCIDGRTAIEYVMLSNEPDDLVIDMIKKLVAAGIDINSVNYFKSNAINSAIQFKNSRILTEMIKLGANIKLTRAKNKILYPMKNRDTIGFACQMGNIDIIRELLDNGAPVHFAKICVEPGRKSSSSTCSSPREWITLSEESQGPCPQSGRLEGNRRFPLLHSELVSRDTRDDKVEHHDQKIFISVPTSLVISLLYRLEQVAIYLMNLDIIKSSLQDPTGISDDPDGISYIKKFLLKISLDEGITNENILINFVPKSLCKKICSKYKKSQLEIYEIMFARHIPLYSNNKYFITKTLSSLSRILYTIFTYKKTKDMRILFREMDELYDIISSGEDDVIESCITGISCIIRYFNVSDIRKCIDIVRGLYIYSDEESSGKKSIYGSPIMHTINYAVILNNMPLSKKIKEIENLMNASKKMLSKFRKRNKKNYNTNNDECPNCICGNCGNCYYDSLESYDDSLELHDDSLELHDDSLELHDDSCGDCNSDNSSGDYFSANDSGSISWSNESDGENNPDPDYYDTISDDDVFNHDSLEYFLVDEFDNQYLFRNPTIDTINTIDNGKKDFNKEKLEEISENNSGKNNSGKNNTGKNNTGKNNTEKYLIKTNKNFQHNTVLTEQTNNTSLIKFHKINIDAQHRMFVRKSLFKLYWPTKAEHYDKMFNKLMCKEYMYEIKDKKIIIYHCNKIEAIIHKLKTRSSNSWIKYYAPNIGVPNKSDDNHMFPSIMDFCLKFWSCIEKKNPDINNIGKSNTLIYFYGELLIGENMEKGCFEYFINSGGTLFHRMFRPYCNVLFGIKKIIENVLIDG